MHCRTSKFRHPYEPLGPSPAGNPFCFSFLLHQQHNDSRIRSRLKSDGATAPFAIHVSLHVRRGRPFSLGYVLTVCNGNVHAIKFSS